MDWWYQSLLLVDVSDISTLLPGRAANDLCVVKPTDYSLFAGFIHLGAGLACGFTGLAAGYAIGFVGDAVCANDQYLMDRILTI